MKYYLYIKSHCAYPDYEDEVEAESKDEAAKLFLKNMPYEGGGEWDEDFLKRHMGTDEDFKANI